LDEQVTASNKTKITERNSPSETALLYLDPRCLASSKQEEERLCRLHSEQRVRLRRTTIRRK
jgi:hypothetical protein